MLDEIKEILIRNGIITYDELQTIMNGTSKGEKFEDLIVKSGKIKKEELQKLIFNHLYFEKKNLLKIIEKNILSDSKREKFKELEKEKKVNDKEFIEKMANEHIISDEEIARSKSEFYNIEYIEEEKAKLDETAMKYMREFDRKYIKTNKFIIFGDKQDKVILGVVEPENIMIAEEVSYKLKKPVMQMVMSIATFENVYNLFLNNLNIDEGIDKESGDEGEDKTYAEELKNEDNPIVKLVNNILNESVRKGASDIHIEPYASKVKIKNRVDGVLIEEMSNISKSFQNMIISRIKILANLNIAEHRIPQDGRFKVKIEARDIDFRVSILPTAFGESAVMRILDKKEGEISLNSLGIVGEDKKILLENGMRPYGMILMTGPTGSGKTTTLYALLKDIKKKEEKFITIEDPVEYQIEDIVQIPVNEKTGLTFAKGLRAILRQDPDKVMVGEIRDRETAEIAVQAALTGHLVLSTIHANNTVEAIGRLINIGIDPYQFSTALNLIVGQRLMRKICKDCHGKGCIRCENTGYRGRTGVYEIFQLSQEIKQMIIDGDSLIKIKERAIKDGMIEIEDKAKEKVKNNETTIIEYERIIGKWE